MQIGTVYIPEPMSYGLQSRVTHYDFVMLGRIDYMKFCEYEFDDYSEDVWDNFKKWMREKK